MEIMTATENRWHKVLATLSKKSIGINMVVNITEAVTKVFDNLRTVPRAVLCVARRLLRTKCLMPLIIITVLLIITLTVRTKFNKANTPSENFTTSTKLNALTKETGIVTAGTKVVC